MGNVLENVLRNEEKQKLRKADSRNETEGKNKTTFFLWLTQLAYIFIEYDNKQRNELQDQFML